GDYSYGIYIFAFPVQQMLASRLPGLGPWGVMAGAALPVAVLAVLSWRLVERRALARKDALARRLARAFGG
ncbi:MAG TPA: acyltransferase, partial [Burkholderiaceae bacterium]